MPEIKFSLLLIASIAVTAQTPPPEITPAQHPDIATLSAAVRTGVRTAPQTPPGADMLVREAQAAGQSGEARRKWAHAYVVLKGTLWDEQQDYAWSLALRRPEVADSALPLIAHLTQSYPTSYRPKGDLRLRASLRGLDAKPVRMLGTFDMPSRDLIEQPFGFDANLNGVPNGAYVLSVELNEGGAMVERLALPLQIVRGILTERAAVEARLDKVHGHDGAKASVRYPYMLAETVNVGRRQLTAADFGLPFQPQLPYDFSRGLQASANLLQSLERGADPLFRAKGDTERHYWFEDAREMMAYHVYAPLRWNGKSKLPMVLVLHGNTRDQDYYFDRDDHILAKLAEQHGYLVVCPMGYRPSAGWGSNSLTRPSRQGELSEKDALNVLDLVMREYPVDSERVYLFGHSAGGAGTWYLGQKYANKWAAIAASAAATRPDGFPFEKLKGLPIMIVHGEADDEVPVARSRAMIQAAKEHGLDPKYLEVPGATHLTIVAIVEPRVFDFFDAHPRKER